ncbi:uncharacterized protein LOC111078547 [Drosophila obscura]|uniref:uncharacterized protein LOC111078547 n=1 Tax=Drosophila obscura TaxID=7282 RepID=UPI001BB1B923|nr:uncharacterized protein LOC111078547 [Drosophila obscura]
MYKLLPFSGDLMRYILQPLKSSKRKNAYSIWKFCPMKQAKQAYSKLHYCQFCKPDLFPLIFWFVLALSIWGAACTLKQTLKLFSCPNSKLAMWRNREFHVFSAKLLHSARLIGSCATITVWCMLTCGLVMLKPELMDPWFVLYTCVMIAELIVWVYEVLTGHIQLELHQGLTLILPIVNLMMVACVKTVIEKSLKDHVEDSLRIF